MNVSGSVSIVFVWGAANLAYIRYYFWFVFRLSQRKSDSDRYWLRFRKNRGAFRDLDGYVRFDRDNRSDDGYAAKTFFLSAQPIPAFIAFVGCFAMFFIFSTALWWSGAPSGTEVFYVYKLVSC